MGRQSQRPADRLQARLDEARQGRTVQAQRRAGGDHADRLLHFPGTGIQDNLADKAKKLGIPVWKFGGACAPPYLTSSICNAIIGDPSEHFALMKRLSQRRLATLRSGHATRLPSVNRVHRGGDLGHPGPKLRRFQHFSFGSKTLQRNTSFPDRPDSHDCDTPSIRFSFTFDPRRRADKGRCEHLKYFDAPRRKPDGRQILV
jgi:hypothetical protein